MPRLPFSLSFPTCVPVFLLSAAVATAQATPSPSQAPAPAQAPAAAPAVTPAAVRSPLLAGGHNIDVAAIMNAALDGDVRAQRTMGDVFRLGIGGEMNVDESMAWFRRAAAGGDDYSIGFVSAKADKHDEARAAYRRAAERGDAVAQAALGASYFGVGGNAIRPATDFAQSLAWYRRSAEQGYFEGLFGLGGLYATGLGVTRDMMEAHKWSSLGISLAGPMAIAKYRQQTLDSLEGAMTASQIAEARKRADAWRATAPAAVRALAASAPDVPASPVSEYLARVRADAERGSVPALRSLAEMYTEGNLVPPDRSEALAYYRKAADRGDDYSLGVLYTEGETVPQDFEKALAAFRRAADRGEGAAMSAIGQLYFLGGSPFRQDRTFPKDYALAFEWYTRAVARGHYEGMIGLGALHSAGRGTPRDLVQAYKFIDLASSIGPEPSRLRAQGLLDLLKLALTEEQVADARKRADDWRDANRFLYSPPLPPSTPRR